MIIISSLEVAFMYLCCPWGQFAHVFVFFNLSSGRCKKTHNIMLKQQLRMNKVIDPSYTYMRADWGVPREVWSWARWEVYPCSPYSPPYPALPAPAAQLTAHPNRPQQIWGIPVLHNDHYLFCIFFFLMNDLHLIIYFAKRSRNSITDLLGPVLLLRYVLHHVIDLVNVA